MTYRKFTADLAGFSLLLPEDWEEYNESGNEEGYTFFNSNNWSGNFRVTPYRWTDTDSNTENKAKEFVSEQLIENEGAILLKIGVFDCAHFQIETVQNVNQLVVYFWVLGKDNFLFMCSFTTRKSTDSSKGNKSELDVVQGIIRSITIL